MSVAVARRPGQPAAPPAATLRLVRFTAGGGVFALPLDRVPEVVQARNMLAQPARGWAGLWSRDHQPVPVADLAAVLGLPAANSSARRVVLLNAATAPEQPGPVVYGLAVDDVPVTITVVRDELQPLSPRMCPPGQTVLAASIVREADVVLVLDADALIARLAPAVVRADDGRVTDLRPLTRRTMGTGRLTSPPSVQRVPVPPQQEERAILLGRIEPADGGAGFQPAVPIAWVREVRASEPVALLPEAPAAVLGLLSWRGYALPVVELAWRLTGIPGRGVREPGARLLIIGPPAGEPLGALLAASVQGLVSVASPARNQSTPRFPETLDGGLLAAWTSHEGEPLALLAPDALFA